MQEGLRKITDKRGQHTIGLPFGMIFAIFLIVIFLSIAFIAIRHFLKVGRCSSVGQFYDDTEESQGLQYWVNRVMSSQKSSTEFDIDLPSGIKKVCFADLRAEITAPGEDYDMIEEFDIYEANVFLVPPNDACNAPYKMIEHLNISKITANENPYCVDVDSGLTIKKGIYDKDVVVERVG